MLVVMPQKREYRNGAIMSKKLSQLSPAEIPAQFADLQQMLALSDVARDYEKKKIDGAQLLQQLTQIIPEPTSRERVYQKLTSENYAVE